MKDLENISYTTPHGIDKSNLDLSVSPADNFYEYACGGWKKQHPLTAEYSHFGTFDLIRENSRIQLQELIMKLKENPETAKAGTNAQKVSDLYEMGMDEKRLNEEGASPVIPLVEKVKDATPDKFAEIIAWNHNGVSGSFFNTGVGPDPKDSDMNIMHIGETGLGLGDRDYYLEKNEENDRILAAYEKYVKRIVELIGYSQEDQQRVWENVITLETEFARHKMTREERRNPLARYNLMNIDEIRSKYNNFDWDTYFKELGIEIVDKANVSSVRFMEFLNSYIPTLDWQTIQDYLIFEVVSDSSGLLSDDFIDANFEMFGRVMSGKEEQEPRWKRAMAIPNSMLGEAVGQLYVEKYFPASAKEYMLKLVGNLKESLAEHIKNLDRLSDSTKEKALDKLAVFSVKIGYPDTWKDYSGISVSPEKSYLENVLAASVWYTQDNYSKLGKPVDKKEWHMTPQTVNAYYSPSVNEICFPAGILQKPYFDPEADDALNYGAIGVIIGHEMTHGFDDQGRQFDKNGNLNDWWTEEDSNKFNALADKLVERFDAVEVAPGVHANGRYTLGENIADQGGLRIALTAYRNHLNGNPGMIIDGYTPLQRFYLSYANVWAGNIRNEEILVRTKTDPHSLGKLRVNETLKNISEFFEAFGIKEGDNMYRPEQQRVIIW